MQRTVLAALSALTLAACAESPAGLGEPPGSPAYEPSNPSAATFDPRDFAWSTAPGSGVISGVLAYHRGGRFSCQASDVLLTPETAWSRRRMVILYGSASAAAAPVSIVRARTPTAGTGDYARFVRRTTCDENNHFTFKDLPDGGWFVITVGKPVDGAEEPVAVMRRVETHGGGVMAVLS